MLCSEKKSADRRAMASGVRCIACGVGGDRVLEICWNTNAY